MRRIVVLCCALAVMAGSGAARAAYAPAELWFKFQNAAIVESSGVAPSARTDDVVFTHNDSGDTARFFAVRTSNGALAGVYNLEGMRSIDIEDMGSGPGPDGEPALFFADIGDNTAPRPVRPFVLVHVVAEPPVAPTGAVEQTLPILETQMLVYEDGPHNAETLLVDPSTGRVAIVTKEPSGISGLYVAGDPVASGDHPVAGSPRRGGVRVLNRRGVIDFNQIADPDGLGQTSATGGDISPDGTRVVVRTYWEAFEWSIEDGDWGEAVAGPFERIDTPGTVLGGEAIAYSRDGSSLIITNEGVGTNCYRLRRL